MAAERVVCRLRSAKKLEREAALAELQRAAPGLAPGDRAAVVRELLTTLEDTAAPRETLLGCLAGARLLVQHTASESAASEPFMQPALRLLREGQDIRLQTTAGELIGALAQKQGPVVYEESKDLLLGLIQKGLENDSKGGIEGDSAQEILHADMSSFSTLEASLRTLQGIADSCRGQMSSLIDKELILTLAKALAHKNHGAREAAFYLAASLATCISEAEKQGHENSSIIIMEFGHVVSGKLADGLADEWSPVRLAASVAIRKFLVALPNEKSRKSFYPILLPRMCLNRYYAAEGVRIYSQETWRQVTGSAGRELVQQNLAQVVNFYCESAQAGCHAVREAACSCMAELATKLQMDTVRPYVQRLLTSLLVCFNDDSWPVRDAACLACGSFAANFPNESESSLPSLYPMFYRNLEDVIPSVRAGAATALAGVAKARGATTLGEIMARLEDGLKGVAKQPKDTPDQTDTKQGVMCSMTPRMGRTGSMDHRFYRPSQPWELADGCVMLLSELSTVPSASATVTCALPVLAEVCSLKHYSSHLVFLETVCKHLPTIARGIGRKNFKLHLDSFFKPIFYALESENALTSSAASQCLNQLSTFIGPGVLRARVETHCPNYLKHLDANMFIAPY